MLTTNALTRVLFFTSILPIYVFLFRLVQSSYFYLTRPLSKLSRRFVRLYDYTISFYDTFVETTYNSYRVDILGLRATRSYSFDRSRRFEYIYKYRVSTSYDALAFESRYKLSVNKNRRHVRREA